MESKVTAAGAVSSFRRRGHSPSGGPSPARYGRRLYATTCGAGECQGSSRPEHEAQPIGLDKGPPAAGTKTFERLHVVPTQLTSGGHAMEECGTNSTDLRRNAYGCVGRLWPRGADVAQVCRRTSQLAEEAWRWDRAIATSWWRWTGHLGGLGHRKPWRWCVNVVA